jgi:two-component system cell cycle response regulator
VSQSELVATNPPPSVQPTDSANRVLIAEDDAMFRRILRTWLANWGFQTIFAKDGAEAWDILEQEQPPQLLILDWEMPKINGIELCRRIRQRQQCAYQYVLLVTGKDDKHQVVEGLEAGADDYLIKPIDRHELHARLRVGRRILSLQTDLIQTREELRFQATHDALTGVWNRGALLDVFRRELIRAARSQSSTAVLMIDVDHFKNVNDAHGHLIGDVVLKEVVRRMQYAVRSYDFVGRYGGEEFLMVLPGCDLSQARDSAERVRSAVACRPVLADGLELPVTISIGVAVADSTATTEMEILAIADAAMYKAKDGGRNCIAMPG